MSEMVVQADPVARAGELQALAHELADAYRDRVGRYQHELGLSPQEAAAKAEEPCLLSRAWVVQDYPADQVIWEGLAELYRHGPEKILDRWEQIKQAAPEDVRSGDWAARAVEGRDRTGPWERALFMAVRAELTEGLQPRNGVERQLVDTMAQAQVALCAWLSRVIDAAIPAEAEAAAAMVERFNRVFLRTLRAYGDLRKGPLAVFVQNAGQVNVAGRQVNLARGPL
jgi:hypothetical protein